MERPNGMYILRAIEETENGVNEEDFPVWSGFLTLSSALSPLVEDNSAISFKSDDGVIPMRDPIEDVRCLMKWFIRDPTFSIDVHNMKPLARLADKYIIDALLRDIRLFTKGLVQDRVGTSSDLFFFATRYDFQELYEFCLSTFTIRSSILELLGKPTGLETLAQTHNIPLKTLSRLVATFLSVAGYCKHHVILNSDCASCRQSYWNGHRR